MTNNNSPKISIIVPVYNSEKYLHNCINSILEQTLGEFELLLINDGSTDSSGIICDQYSKRDKRIKVFHKRNGGVSSARNIGLDNAIGKWITFVDSDDYVGTGFIKDFSLNSSRSELFLQGYTIRKNGEQIKESYYNSEYTGSPTPSFFVYAEQMNLLNSPVSKLFSRRIINKYNLRFDTNTSYGEDHIFVLEYFQKVKTITTSFGKSYTYNQVQESLTRRVVPYRELVYYTKRTLELQIKLEKEFEDINFTKTLNSRLYLNIIRTIKSFFKSKQVTLNEYTILVSDMRRMIRKRMHGIQLYQRLIYYLFFVPPFVSFFIFKTLF